MKIAPLFGEGVAGSSYPVTRQRRLNCYFELRPDGDKTKVAIFGTPGLKLAFSLGATLRGIFATHQGGLYAVSGGKFYSLSETGQTLYSAAVSTSDGYCSINASPTQTVMVDGLNLYLYNGSTLATITATSFPAGANTIVYLAGYFIAEQPGTQKFWVSNLDDGTLWDGLAFASASQYDDTLLAVDALTGNLVLFSQAHIEFWQNVGTTPQPFQPILSTTSEYGIAAIWSRAHINSSIIFLAANPQSTYQVCQITGYTVQVISTADIDYIINTFFTVSDAVGLAYVINGHPMYQITFPSEDQSFLYDCSTSAWSEVQTGTTLQYSTRHWGQFSTVNPVGGDTLVTDYASGNVYYLSEETFTDNGKTIVREVVTRHGSEDFNTFIIDEFYLDMETGVGTDTGQGMNPVITLEVSKDNGRTWATPRTMSLGALGKYNTRVIARRFGQARDFVFRIRMTDPVKFVITEGAVSVRAGPQ